MTMFSVMVTAASAYGEHAPEHLVGLSTGVDPYNGGTRRPLVDRTATGVIVAMREEAADSGCELLADGPDERKRIPHSAWRSRFSEGGGPQDDVPAGGRSPLPKAPPSVGGSTVRYVP
jgi:hypothetical protein